LLVTIGQPSVRALVTLASEQDRDTEWRILGALALIGDAAGLPRVLSAARSAEPALRAAAYRALRTVADESAIPVLVQGLAEDDSDVRTDAAAALARLGSSSRAAARQATLDAGSTRARSAACAALAHNEAGIGTLAELLADQNPAVRFHAELALSACTDRAVPALRELLAAPVPAQRNAALRILSAIGSSAVPTLVAATGSTDEFVAVKAVDALAAVRAPGVKQELLRLIGSAAPQIRNRAAAALCARGDDVLDALLRRLSSDNPQLRAAAADALVFVGGRAVPQVLSLARHGANGRREEAIALLERLPGPAAVFAASQLRWSRSHRSDASEDQPE
jgi:HEAT repeat protein